MTTQTVQNYRALISWTNGQQTTIGMVAKSTSDVFHTVRDMFHSNDIVELFAASVQDINDTEAANAAANAVAEDEFERYMKSNTDMYEDTCGGGDYESHQYGDYQCEDAADYDVDFPPINKPSLRRHVEAF